MTSTALPAVKEDLSLVNPCWLLFSHVIRDDIQNYLLHHLFRDGDEANYSVLSWVFLLAPFEDWGDINHLPGLRQLPYSPRSFKNNRVAQQKHQPALSALVDALHQGLWICADLSKRSVTQSTLSSGVFLLPVLLSYLQCLRLILSVKTEEMKAFSDSGIVCHCISHLL